MEYSESEGDSSDEECCFSGSSDEESCAQVQKASESVLASKACTEDVRTANVIAAEAVTCLVIDRDCKGSEGLVETIKKYRQIFHGNPSKPSSVKPREKRGG